MRKLISAVTSLAMAATMVTAALPVVASAADSTKGFSIKTYDINNPSAAAGSSTITIDKKDIPAGGYVIPSALYYSEATENSTSSLLVGLTTDTKDISFNKYEPDESYTSEKATYTLGGVEFSTDCYISFAGFCASARTGYKPGGKYIFGLDSSQSVAGTDNYYLGCSWMNNGTDYSWAGDASDSYPFYVFDTVLSENIKPGTYKVMYCDYNTDVTGVNNNPSPMVEGGGNRYTLAAEGNDKKLTVEEMTIVVTDGDAPIESSTTTTTTTTTTKQSTTSTTTTQKPQSNADVKFEFVDVETGSTEVKLESGKGATIEVDVNIDAGDNAISALDVQFKASNGIKISEILDGTMAFPGKTVSTNLEDLRANYATLKGDEPIKPENGKSAFMLTVEVPAGTPDGTYIVDFAEQCKIFKDNTKFNYTTSSTPLTITIGEGGVVTPPETDDAQVKFEFVDVESGKTTVNVDPEKGATIEVDVNIDAGDNAISALDVQFKASNGIKISEILDGTMAFPGKTVSTNLEDLRANYATLKGDEPIKPENGKSAFMLTVEVPAGTPAGTYTVDFADQCKIFRDNTKFNYTTSSTPLTIIVGEPPVTSGSTTTTTTTATTSKQTTTTTTQPPQTDAEVKFEFVDVESGSTEVNLESGKGATIEVDVNIYAGDNAISALDVQFKASEGIKISEILDGTMAFPGKTVSTNLEDLRANYATLKGDEPIKPENGKSAFMLTVEVPAGTPDGTYYVDFADQCKIFRDNTKFNYTTSSTPLKIVIGDIVTTSASTTTTTTTTTTTKDTTTTTSTTTTTTTTKDTTTSTTTSTTTVPSEVVWGDTNCNGVVNVADVVVLNRLLNDPSYVVMNPDTKADVTAQGKINADVVNKNGAAHVGTLDTDDVAAIINHILGIK